MINITLDVSSFTHQDKLVTFNRIADLVRHYLQKPHNEKFSDSILLVCHDPHRDVPLSLGRDAEYYYCWVISIDLSKFFKIMPEEKLYKLIALLKEFDTHNLNDPTYAEKARQELEIDPCWKQLGFIDENPAKTDGCCKKDE